MPHVAVRIPQLGEGLQEALLIDFIKQPGDAVRRDEPLYVMETDKATTEVESPYAGKLVEWTGKAGTVYPIGAEIGKMEVAEGVKEMAAGHGPAGETGGQESGVGGQETEVSRDAPAERGGHLRHSAQESNGAEHHDNGQEHHHAVAPVEAAAGSQSRNLLIPPRTRAYLRQHGLLEVADEIPAADRKLMPADVDAYLAKQQAAPPAAAPVASSSRKVALSKDISYDDRELSRQQRTLNFRMLRGMQVCVPASVVVDMDWTAIEHAKLELEQAQGKQRPSSFTLFLWSVVQSLRNHPKFRSTLVQEANVLRTFRGVNLGIAVALPGDELVTAVVPNADGLSFGEFIAAVRQQIDLARNGKDQADAATTVSVSNIAGFGVRSGTPVVVAPAVATLAVGEATWHPMPKMGGFDFRRQSTVCMTFDHRIVNGMGALQFVKELKQRAEEFVLPK